MEGSDRGGKTLAPTRVKEDPESPSCHGVKVEATEPSQVKEELKCESSTDCVSETILYAGHLVKDELVLEPVRVELHRRDEDSSIEEKRREVKISSPELKTVPGSYTFTDSLHHIGTKNTYECDSCSKTFQHKHDLIDHVKTHQRENSESLTKESNLFIREPIEKVACKICNKMYVKGYMRIHERCHTGAKPYSCEVCKKEFAALSNFRDHKRTHTEERPYSCDVCKKSFSRLHYLKMHKRSHTGEKPYTCAICKKGFAQSANLKSHIRIHTGERPYECPICGKRFAQGSGLEIHKRSHTGDKPYTCEICKKEFTALGNLKTHQRIHSGEKPYTCEVCKKGFPQLSNLKTHNRIHSGEKPYTCEVCKKGFPQLSNLQAHVRKHTLSLSVVQ